MTNRPDQVGRGSGRRAEYHSLKLETVAEGVERPVQLTQLRALGARLGQGFLFARPMSATGITELLGERRRMVS